MASDDLIDAFNEAVSFFEAQDSGEWQSKAVRSLSKKFTLLARGAADTERAPLVKKMTEFLTDYVDRRYDKPDYEDVDRMTEDIGSLGQALIGAAEPGMIPEGTARKLNLSAADIIGLAEGVRSEDTYQAFQEQADKISEIANALEPLEVKPKSTAPGVGTSPGKPRQFNL